MKNYAVGLDIGTTKVVAIIAERASNDRIKILGIGHAPSTGVQRGVVTNILHTTEAVTRAVKMAEEQAGLPVSDIVVGIAGQHIRSLQHADYITRTQPEEVIDEEDLDALNDNVHRLVMLPGEEIIHVLPQVYKVDNEIGVKEPIGMSGSRLEASFHIVVGKINSIQNIGRCVKSSGYKISGLTLEPLASAKACLSPDEKDAGVALVDIGGGTTDIAIFKDGIIRHTAVIPFGGKIITEDIKNACEIIEKQAELLKVKFGSCWPGENKDNEIVSIPGLRGREPKEISLKNLSKIIYSRVLEMIDSVDAEIKGYINNDDSKRLIGGIVLTGGGAKLKHLKTLVKYETGYDVRIGYPQEKLESETSSRLSSPMYATAVGLALEAVEKREFEIELEQERLAAAQLEEPKEEFVEIPSPENKRIDEIPPKEEVQTITENEKKKKDKSNFFDRWSGKFLKFLEGEE
jgi:cell division protein FtsA